MRVGDYRRGLGRKDYRMTGQARAESQTPVFVERSTAGRIKEPGIVRLAVTIAVRGQDEPVRFTFGIRT